jgi:hypothetical protein
MRILATIPTSLVLVFTLAACASTSQQPGAEAAGYDERVLTRSDDEVSVSISVLSAGESRSVYGVDLAAKDIQPVWIEVSNRSSSNLWLMSTALDPNFFPASEAAGAFAATVQGGTAAGLAGKFERLAFRNPVTAGKSVSGFVLTNLERGVKMVQVDLFASGRFKSFSFLASVPGFRSDYKARGIFENRPYADHEIIDYTDDSQLREALASLPCCVTNDDASRDGDPLNLVVVGGVDDAFPALVRRGWRPTEQTWTGSVLKMIDSVLSGERYPYAPVSPLYLFGRPQDLALQKARDNIHQRNHLRLWLSPIRFRGQPVWVGQISRDIGTRLTIHSPYLTTHKIDPDVDEARTALLEDMAYSQSLARLGLVEGVGAADRDSPRGNLTRDPYFTDGLRGVLVFTDQPTALTEIEILPWVFNEGGYIERLHDRSQERQ